MARSRPKKIVSHHAMKLRQIIAANLSARIAELYSGIPPSTAYSAIKKATGISLSTLQRIIGKEVGPQSDTLADLGHHLGLSVAEMLTKSTEAPLPTTPKTDGVATQRLQRRSSAAP
jgi:hypothetical protein